MINRFREQGVVAHVAYDARAHFLRQKRKACPPHEALGVAQHLVEPHRAEKVQGVGPAEKAESLQKPGEPKVMIAVKMSQQDRGDPRQTRRAHQLTLGPLAAIYEDALSAPDQQQAGQTSVNRRHPSGRAEEYELQIHRSSALGSVRLLAERTLDQEPHPLVEQGVGIMEEGRVAAAGVGDETSIRLLHAGAAF